MRDLRPKNQRSVIPTPSWPSGSSPLGLCWFQPWHSQYLSKLKTVKLYIILLSFHMILNHLNRSSDERVIPQNQGSVIPTRSWLSRSSPLGLGLSSCSFVLFLWSLTTYFPFRASCPCLVTLLGPMTLQVCKAYQLWYSLYEPTYKLQLWDFVRF